MSASGAAAAGRELTDDHPVAEAVGGAPGQAAGDQADPRDTPDPRPNRQHRRDSSR